MSKAAILPGYWHDRLAVNSKTAIFHQWDQLVASGCIDNFRIAAGQLEGFREGWFFADSDAFKWLDAAARVHGNQPGPHLAELMDEFIRLIGEAQQPDGYIYTYNQIHFPGTRWTNLQIEHELYCHGHLIEAGVSHHQATSRVDLLEIARRAADRIVADFRGKGPKYTPGHQEIEIALLRLHQATAETKYLEMARQFIEQRGRIRGFGLSLFQQNSDSGRRGKQVNQQRQAYLQEHTDYTPAQVPAGNEAKKPWNINLRWILNTLKGKYFQHHAPVREQKVPVGHAVRFAYLETAIAMLGRETGDPSFLPPLESAWEHMVTRKMYVTGGIGSLPVLEGFGKDYELDPEIAYNETCAALGSMFWNWEMAQWTGKSQYSDLFEWQLYNASAVGMGLDGTQYLYNNPLTCRGGVTRKAWYEVPCCPSNVSRTWADLGKYLYSHDKGNIWVHQYVNSEAAFEKYGGVKLKVETGLPWQGHVRIELESNEEREFSLHLRIPSWASGIAVRINSEEQTNTPAGASTGEMEPTGSGYDPRKSNFWTIQRTWHAGDVVEIFFDMAIQAHHAHPKVKGRENKVAVSQGPIVFCLESVDNPNVDIFNVQLDLESLESYYDSNLLGGTSVITAESKHSQPLKLIPYHLWANRGPSQMTVWIKN